MIARALFRASLRSLKSLDRPLPLQEPIKVSEWGKFKRLTSAHLDVEASSVFPWASKGGVITREDLTQILRRKYREPGDLNDGFAALRSFSNLKDMPSSTTTTNGVTVTAVSKYMGLSTDSGSHVFAYRIRISNSGELVHLRSRHWIIDTGHSSVVVPKGSPGVVGQTPSLKRGAHFEYVSGTEINAEMATMRGSFEFSTDAGDTFDVIVDPFHLKA